MGFKKDLAGDEYREDLEHKATMRHIETRDALNVVERRLCSRTRGVRSTIIEFILMWRAYTHQ